MKLQANHDDMMRAKYCGVYLQCQYYVTHNKLLESKKKLYMLSLCQSLRTTSLHNDSGICLAQPSHEVDIEENLEKLVKSQVVPQGSGY